jgi:DNA-binding transcriptional ArsR family regulator
MGWFMRFVQVLAISAAVIASSIVYASARDASPAEASRVERHLRALGYTAIVDVDVQGGRFVVDAVNPHGRNVDVILDRRTLNVIRELRS